MAKKAKTKSKANNPFSNSPGFIKAFEDGGVTTKLSAIIFGLGNLAHKQIIKGLLFLFMEVLYLYFMVSFGAQALVNFTTLGKVQSGQVWDESIQCFVTQKGDNSMLFLLYGVVTIFVTIGLIFILRASVKSAYEVEMRAKAGKSIPTFLDDLKNLFDKNLHKTLLFLPMSGILVFTILPLVFMILMAFTNYDRYHQPPGNLFHWVGFKNFTQFFKMGSSLADAFWPILGWTIIWAIFATFLNYIFGMILAIVINRKDTKIKGFWRFIFVLSIAVPQFVSLLTMKTVFQEHGAANAILQAIGILKNDQTLPFLLKANWARVTVIVVNLWVGIPYTMLQTTGILQNIPAELYESAKVDGASAFVTFFKITLPYMLFVTTPYLITSFIGNVNNFNVIFLLTGGNPATMSYYGGTAGKTDLLVTWLYKLTITYKDYNLGAVIGILVFIITATFSLITYRCTGSYKNEEEFQ